MVEAEALCERMAEVAPWRQLLSSSLKANSHLKHSSYFQLATVRPDGSPANRTVVFRGFVEGTDMVQFTTDHRSKKIEDFHHNPRGEICWYFTDSWEQFRIQGVIDVINCSKTDMIKNNRRQKAWFELSLRSRLQFIGPSPAIPLLENSLVSEAQLNPSDGPVDTFCLVTLDPEEVDYLNLKKNQRILFKRTPTTPESCVKWSQVYVNP